jgi:transposase
LPHITSLIIDNTIIHYSDDIKQIYSAARVGLEIIAPYTPDTNPIKGFFSRLKATIKSQ